MLVLSLVLAQMSSERASHASAYICTRNKKFAGITQDVLVAMLNCQTVRWGSVVMIG
jgi:hypothetical protein